MYSWWALNFFVIQVEIKVNSKLLGSWIFCISQYLWRANLCNYCQGYHNQIIRGNSCIYFFCFIFHAHELDFPWNYAALHCSFLGRNIEKPFLSLQRVSCYRKRGKKLLTVNKVFAKHIFWFLLKPCKDIHHYCIEYNRSIW